MSKLQYDIGDIEETARHGEERGAAWERAKIAKALEEELENATARHSKDEKDAMYDAGYRAGIEEAIRITSEDKR
jgi:hypothetical protein